MRAVVAVAVDPSVPDGEAARRARTDVRVVRDDDERVAGLVHAVEERKHLLARAGVEVAGGLVGEQQGRAVHERARDRDPLALAAGDLVREVIGPLREAHAPERLEGALASLAPRHAAVHEGELDVLGGGGAAGG